MNRTHKILANATPRDAGKIINRLKGLTSCEPTATQNFSAEENATYGLVGIRRMNRTEKRAK